MKDAGVNENGGGRPRARRAVVGVTTLVVLVIAAGAALAQQQYFCGYENFCTDAHGAPEADTGRIEPLSASSVEVYGDVVPANEVTTYRVNYDAIGSPWCSSGGTAGSPAHQSDTKTLPQADESGYSVLVALSGLTPGAQYCAALAAQNRVGSGTGSLVVFTAGVSVFTSQVFSTDDTTAVVAGSVNPGGSPTTYAAEWDDAGSSWCASGGSSGTPAHTTAPIALGATTPGQQFVTVDLTGLASAHRYCGAITAIQSAGSVTDLPPVAFFTGASISLETPQSYTATSASVSGYIQPAGREVSHAVQYDTAQSSWCTSGGTTGTPLQTAAERIDDDDGDFARYSTDLHDLTPGVAYCVAAVLLNGTTVVAATDQAQVTPGAARAYTGRVLPSSATSVTVEGELTTFGRPGTYRVQYDDASSAWCRGQGQTGDPAHESAAEAAADGPVSVTVPGLTQGAAYCARIIASNDYGDDDTGEPVEFVVNGLVVYGGRTARTSGTTATVQAEVNPVGQATQYRADYALADTTWCQTNGATGAPTASSANQSLPGDHEEHDATAVLSGLAPDSAYCARFVAGNDSGTVTGAPMTIAATAGRAPFVLADREANTTGPTSADVSGRVNQRGQATTYRAFYDAADSEWCRSGATSGTPASSTMPQPVRGRPTATFTKYISVSLSGLEQGREYCAILSATNGSGTSQSSRVASFAVGLPYVSTDEIVPTGPTGDTLTGFLNPSGQTSTYRAAYDVATSAWCQSDGFFGTPAHVTSPQTLPDTDLESHRIEADLTGLQTGQRYCADFVASNASGPAPFSYDSVRFVPGRAVVDVDDVDDVGETTATVRGSVNPGGLATSYSALYDVESSAFCSGSDDPADATPAQTLPVDATTHQVSIVLSDLSPHTEYCVALQATNGAGTVASYPSSFTTAGTGAGVPVNGSPPTVSGTAEVGSQLTAQQGTWSNAPTSFTHAWRSCDSAGASCVAIADANGLSYVVQPADVGHRLRTSETAINAAGSSGATNSAPTAVVAAVGSPSPSPSVTGSPTAGPPDEPGTPTAVPSPGGTSTPAPTVADQAALAAGLAAFKGRPAGASPAGTAVFVFGADTLPAGTKLSLSLLTGTASRAKTKIATATKTVHPGKATRIKLKLSSRARKRLRKHKLKAVLKVTARAPSGARRTVSRSVTLRRAR